MARREHARAAPRSRAARPSRRSSPSSRSWRSGWFPVGWRWARAGLVRSSTAPPGGPPASPSPHSSASAAARSHVGSWSSSGGKRRLGVHRRDVPVEPERVGLGSEAALGERSLERPVLREHRGRRLRADAARARDLVGRVAAERDEVGHLLRLDAVALAHLGRPDARQRPAAVLRLQDRRLLADELERVAVAARDEGLASPRLLERDPGREEVVRLVPGRLRGREAHRLDQLRRQVELLEQVVVELAPALVALERLVPVGRHGQRVPGDEHGTRLLLLPEPDEQDCQRR